MSVTERRHRQTMEALVAANRMRSGQFVLKQEVHAGKATLAEALTDSRVSAKTTVVDLLTWQRRWGTKRARKAVHRAAIPESKPAAKLTERQRGVLVAVVSEGVHA